MCYLNKTVQTTTSVPYLDYPEFHEVFVNETYPTTTTNTTPPPLHRVFHHLLIAPPPDLPYLYRHKRNAPQNLNNYNNHNNDYTNTDNNRHKRQNLAGIAATCGVLRTIFGLFNQLENHSIQNHVSNLEASTNILIQVQHKNQQPK
jgi:hypothetical protein